MKDSRHPVTNDSGPAAAVFPGHDELAVLCHAQDGASTPLGPVESGSEVRRNDPSGRAKGCNRRWLESTGQATEDVLASPEKGGP